MLTRAKFLRLTGVCRGCACCHTPAVSQGEDR